MFESMFKIAVISDIHGNSWALREVLLDIETRGIETIYNLGDSLYGPLDPAGTANILMQSKIISILGNEDEILIKRNADQKLNPSLEYSRKELSSIHFDWIRALKRTLYINDNLFICHGTPNHIDQYLLEDVFRGFPVLKSNYKIKKAIMQVNAKVILCGHSHLQKSCYVNGISVINPGSVGLQAYTDTNPNFHIMESCSPFAKYAILNMSENNISVEHIMIKYDWEKAAHKARLNNRKDWERWLITGKTNI